MAVANLKTTLSSFAFLFASHTNAMACDGEPLYKLPLKDGRIFGAFAAAELIAKAPIWPDPVGYALGHSQE